MRDRGPRARTCVDNSVTMLSGDGTLSMSIPLHLLMSSHPDQALADLGLHTGDKGPNTHWIHGENIEITVNI